ncbi:MAG: class I SAM-dependent RNA methyltransferase [Candidatus Omnitrophica bacterium]|nr:class I SAM-dependent RNA methyltransferase [Candidatus Omnitrophota bacterium]
MVNRFDFTKPGTVLISCGRGIAPFLETELRELGHPIQSRHETGVIISAGWRQCLRLCLCLRTALHVLWQLGEWRCRTAQELYGYAAALPWETLISPAEYLSVVSRTDTACIRNSQFANQKVKDAIVDRIAAKKGKRPDAGAQRKNAVVNLFWKDDRCWLYLNLSGEKLSDRGYRAIPHQAPLQETLAAALLRAMGYNGSQPLVLPMCGSGTLAVEAALISAGRAPGLVRENFGFMHVLPFHSAEWRSLRAEIAASAKNKTAAPIVASDYDRTALAASRRNALAAGVSQFIEFHQEKFQNTPLPPAPGIILLNPEYGHRLGDAEQLAAVYASIGDFFKQRCAGYLGGIFTGNMELAKKIGLRTKQRMPFFNGDIECRLITYELYAGSRKNTVPNEPRL